MIRIQQLKLPIEHTMQDLEKKLRRELRLKPEESLVYEIRKRSVDERKKPELYFNYVIASVAKQSLTWNEYRGGYRLVSGIATSLTAFAPRNDSVGRVMSLRGGRGYLSLRGGLCPTRQSPA